MIASLLFCDRTGALHGFFSTRGGEIVIGNNIGFVDDRSMIGGLWRSKNDQEQCNNRESCQDPKIRSPAMFIRNVAADERRKIDGAKGHYIKESDALATLMDLFLLALFIDFSILLLCVRPTKYKSPTEDSTIAS